MLVLVPGATGNIGQKVVDGLLARGHQVRILARNPSRIAPEKLACLEGVVQSKGYDDVAALNEACAGVDAIVNTLSGLPELQLEGQLLLLRAAERAGTVKRFLAAAWNYDWRKLELGQHESYDPYLAFHNHVRLTSRNIRPIYILSGVLAEIFFAVTGHGDFSPKNHGAWDPLPDEARPERRKLEIWGSGDEPWHWTTERDAAEFAIEAVLRDDAPEGGFWRLCSGVNTLKEMAQVYEKVRGQGTVDVEINGTVEDLRRRALEARAQGHPTNFWEYIGWFYQLFTVDGTWVFDGLDLDEFKGVQTTSLEQFLRENPGI